MMNSGKVRHNLDFPPSNRTTNHRGIAMRLLPALALALGLAAPAASAQDPKLEEILTLMERRVEGIQDLRFQVDQKADPSWGLPMQPGIAVTWLKGTGLRLRASLEHAMRFSRSGHSIPGPPAE